MAVTVLPDEHHPGIRRPLSTANYGRAPKLLAERMPREHRRISLIHGDTHFGVSFITVPFQFVQYRLVASMAMLVGS